MAPLPWGAGATEDRTEGGPTGTTGLVCGGGGGLDHADQPGGVGMSSDSSGGSRLSKNNCPGPAEGGEPPESADPSGHGHIEPGDVPGNMGLTAISTEPGRTLREEATHELMDGVSARPVYRVLNAWRSWYSDYLNSHIEYEGADGETVRSRLENSYQPGYGDRYYAKLKGIEREVEREFEGLTTVMLTNTASHETATGKARPPADHMRDIADGWDVQRKELHRVLDGYRWEYAKVWEPHQDGYGHMHIAVFVEDVDDDLAAEDFESVMRTYYENTGPAGWDAHRPENAVSVSHEVHDLGCYISEYIGSYGEDPLDRPLSTQTFYAVTWATNTRRVEFSNGAQDLMERDRFRRETGLRPEDRGGGCVESWSEQDGDSDGGAAWKVDAIVNASPEGPDYHDPTSGGVETAVIEGVSNADPPPEL